MARIIAVTWATGGIGSPAPYDLAADGELPEFLRRLDRIDGLVHAAGISEVATVADTDRVAWEQAMAVNVVVTVLDTPSDVDITELALQPPPP